MRFWNRLRDRFQRKRLDAELDEELHFHQEMLERELGPNVGRRRLGNRTALHEEVRAMWSFVWIEELMRDLRYGLRSLARTPAFTAIALFTVALGIGANTAIFSVVYGVLWSPFPYREPDRLVLLNETMKEMPQITVSYPNFLDWRGRTQAFEGMALFKPYQSFTVTGAVGAERVAGALTTANLFDVLGLHPAVGRTLRAEDDRPGAERVALVSDAFWRERLGATQALDTLSLMLDGFSYAVVGVLDSKMGLVGAQVWIPMGLFADDPSFSTRENHPGTLGIARLKPGLTLEQARADLSRVAARLREEYPTQNRGIGATAAWLTEMIIGGVRPALLVLAGAVGLVLIIACANVANLLLGRAASRQREMALRGALGARRGRIVRQLLAESLVLSLAGGALGVAFAFGGVKSLQALHPGNLPRLGSIKMDGTVLVFALLVSVATGVLFGLVPALHAARKDPLASLRDGGRTASTGRSGLRLRSTLMVAEIAMALVLLVGAGLLVKSFDRLTRVDLGFNERTVLSARIELPAGSYGENSRRLAFYADVLEGINALPGVRSAALGTDLPVTSSQQSGITFEGRPPVEAGNDQMVNVARVTPAWFSTMEIPLVSGRGFEPSDGEGAVLVALISEAVVRRFFSDESPIGHRYKEGGATSTNPWITIVGVVREVANGGFDRVPLGTIYKPVAQGETSEVWLAIRTDGKPEAMTPAVRAAVAVIDPGVPLTSVASAEDVVDDLLAAPRFAMLMVLLFATIALVLAAVGIYGVISCSVSERAHEIGVRMALGARRAGVVGMVVRQVVILAGAGILIGSAGAIGLGGVLRKLLFQVTPTDPATFVAMVAVLAAVALGAAALPAWRAARLDPLSALRDE